MEVANSLVPCAAAAQPGMITGDGDDSRCRRNKKSCRGSAADCTGGDDDGECWRRNQRCRVAAGTTEHGGDYMEGDSDMDGRGLDENTDDDDGGDFVYYDSDDEKVFDAQTEDDAEKKALSDPKREKKRRYVVLTEDGVRARQEADTAMVADVLSVPPGVAAVLLRHFKWRSDLIQERWFSDERRVRDAVGLPVLTAINDDGELVVCAICFEGFPGCQMRSAGCAHFYCRACWRGYVRAAVEDGARCLSLRCPDASCLAPVARELVDEVARHADLARYAAFEFRSYVEDSGGRIRWCPGRGCSHAVEFLGCADDAPDVFCECRHGFCFRCGEEAHRPVTCETVRRWQLKNVSDAETANWVLANTKHCPKCRQPIEKNQGCNHMRCRCGHHFCWLCLGPAGGSSHYSCRAGYNDYDPKQVKADPKEERKRQQAKASLDRYLYHYERWAANLSSLNMALADMDKLERSGMVEMAAAVGCEVTDLDFLKEAYEQVADGRRVLRWSHAYGYFLDPEREAKKRELFEYLQNDANNSLERLHGCAELERKELICPASSSDDDGAVADDVAKKKKFQAYREKLANLTRVTRRYFENLVKAFQTDLPEISAVNF